MFLSDLVEKELFSGKTSRGVCTGIGVSLKTFVVKYLLCSSVAFYSPLNPQTDFSVNVSAIEYFDDEHIRLFKLRPVFPKTCAKIYLGRPVYSSEGVYMGSVADVEIENFVAIRLITDRAATYPMSAVCAFSDAVILRKEQPYPIGQRIPARALLEISEKNESIVTRSVLRSAIEKNSLIKLTLSLAPFDRA